jgi:hypothetical protein
MFNKRFFWTNGGGATIILLISLQFALFSTTAKGQECMALSCGDLKLEIVRQDTNVSTSCPSSSAPCTDKFRQLSYKVYLRSHKSIANPNFPYDPFNLDYKMLDVAVKLKQNSTPQYSHIDVVSTQSCFENGAGASWYNYADTLGDKVIFTPTDGTVSISFANLAAGSSDCGSTGPNNTSNVIRFAESSPPFTAQCGPSQSDRCLFVELFTIVVNAYPGEVLQFEFDANNKYEPKSPVSVCAPIPVVTTNTGRNGTFPLQVGVPRLFNGTQNENILAELLPAVSDGFGGWFFPVRIKNTSTTLSLTVTRLEFLLKASLFQMTEPFSYSGAVPREYSGGVDPLTGQNIKYLHYLISPSGLTLAPGGRDTLSIIKIGLPALSNQGWFAGLSFQSAGTKSRIKTTNACTTLKTSGATSSADIDGNSNCSDSSVRFKIEGSNASCNELSVKVGLRSSTPPAALRIKKLEFELDFSWASQGIYLAGVDYDTTWPSGSINCATKGCFGTSPSKTCYDTLGKTFKYCYETSDSSAPLFRLNDFAWMKIRFSMAQNGCIDNVQVKKLRITYSNSSDPCIPVIDPVVGFPICGPKVRGTVLTEKGDGVEEVNMRLDGADIDSTAGIAGCPSVSCTASCSLDSILTNGAGGYGFCDVCTTCNRLKVVPEKDDNPLNGVTTYDLVLISKHILGSEPLNSPYKMIAADANKSRSITTFDIVELRKLILGIYTHLPNNKSWRFVDESYVFPDTLNPFQSVFPEGINCIASPAAGVDFIGVKVGDVNNTAVGNRPAQRPSTHLSWPNLRATPGGVLTVPITYSGSTPMEAVQLGLRFDPAKLQLISPSKGDIESYLLNNFNLLRANEGEIRTLWIPMTDLPEKIQPGAVLFYLSFKVLGELPGGKLPLWLDDQLLDCAAWSADGAEWGVGLAPGSIKRDEPATATPGLQAIFRPNPTLGDATLVVQSLKAEKSRIVLYDAFGRRLFMREVMLQEGRQDIPLPETVQLPTGVYTWKVYTQSLQAQGHLIKQ